ncbi:hypothetical protein Tco_0133109 [Tanacetum coccineum]
MDEGFTASAYPDVHKNLKLTVDEQVIPEEPVSSTGTLSSLQHLAKDLVWTSFTNVHLALPTTIITMQKQQQQLFPLPPQFNKVHPEKQGSRIRKLETMIGTSYDQRSATNLLNAYEIDENRRTQLKVGGSSSVICQALTGSFHRDEVVDFDDDKLRRKTRRRVKQTLKASPGSPPSPPPPPPPP